MSIVKKLDKVDIFLLQRFNSEKKSCVVLGKKLPIFLISFFLWNFLNWLKQICYKEYNYILGLKRHWNEQHLKVYGNFIAPVTTKRPKPISMNTFICDFCGNLTEGRRDFQKHLTYFHIIWNPPIQCNQCDATFALRAQYRNHKKQSHRETRVHYFCDHCEFTTNQKPYMMKHVRKHVVNQTECPICHKFVRILDRHIKGHKMKACKICHKNFTARVLPDHMKQHEKATKCKHCDLTLTPVEMRK